MSPIASDILIRRKLRKEEVELCHTEETKTFVLSIYFPERWKTDESLSLSRTVKKTTKPHKSQSIQAN